MCDVCGVALPVTRQGHVLRETRRIHKCGAKHQAALRSTEQRRWEESQWRRSMALHDLQRQRQEERAAAVHAFRMAAIAADLRTTHGSVGAARQTHRAAAAASLTALPPHVAGKLVDTAAAALMTDAISRAAQNTHVLTELVMTHAC